MSATLRGEAGSKGPAKRRPFLHLYHIWQEVAKVSSELSNYEAAIRDLEAERQEIDLLIEGLKRRRAKDGGESGGMASRPADAGNIADDAFFSMTVADAARKYLGMVKQTKTTAEIAEALLRGGLKSSAFDLPSTVRSIMGLGTSSCASTVNGAFPSGIPERSAPSRDAMSLRLRRRRRGKPRRGKKGAQKQLRANPVSSRPKTMPHWY